MNGMSGMRQMQDPQFRLDWAKRILKLHEQGIKVNPVNPQALREARAILKRAREGA